MSSTSILLPKGGQRTSRSAPSSGTPVNPLLRRRTASAGATPIEAAFLAECGISPAAIAFAVRRADGLEITVESVLIASGALSEEAYYRMLAQRLGAPYFEEPLAFARSLEPGFALASGVAPLAPNELGLRAAFAPRGRQVQELLARTESGRLEAGSFAICAPRRFDQRLRAEFGADLADLAANALCRRQADFSARGGLGVGQRVALAALAAAIPTLALASPASAMAVLYVLLWALFALSIGLRAVAAGAGRSAMRPEALRDSELPVYSIVVPLSDEAEVVPQLVSALAALDYPEAKLDVKLVIERGDRATAKALLAVGLPPWIEVVVAPPGAPSTKPRALNVALASARGDLLVIYDAEDIPEPGQLRLAAARFAAEPDLDCLQARLVIHNFRASWLTQCFALEYAALFDFLCPGLLALGLPIGLGGTSNHFRARALRSIGGWDAWNVAEDADLGVRLSRFGLRIGALESDTLEEAPDKIVDWFKQRVRWQKGWMQTLIVHTRHPLALARQLGPLRTLALYALILGGTAGTLLWPALLLSLLAHAFAPIAAQGAQWRVFADVVTYLLAAAGAQAVLAPMVASIRLRGLSECRGAILALPAYYALACAAAWVALFELVRRPFHWHKTRHRARALAEFVSAGAPRA